VASRQEYNTCISKGLRGKTLGKEERQQEFCIVAKLCSGKAKDRAEAKMICSQPKQPKPSKNPRPGKKGINCEEDMLKIAECLVDHIDMNMASNINSIGPAVANALIECRCPKETPS